MVPDPAASRGVGVSVVIPAYNAEHTIAETLESALAQTLPPREIVVVDDCSTDGTADVVSRFAGVRYLRLPQNTGSARARDYAIERAEGALVAMLDADDIWMPDHLATVVPLLERSPNAVLAFGSGEFFGSQTGDLISKVPEGDPVEAFDIAVRGFIGLHSGAVFRRDAWRSVGGYSSGVGQRDEDLCDDFAFWIRLALVGPFTASHRATVRYRIHAAQGTTRKREQIAAQYRVRLRTVQQLRGAGDTERALALESRLRTIWVEEIDYVWQKRASTWMRWYLDVVDLVPGLPAATRRHYALRARIPAVLMIALERGPVEATRRAAQRMRRLVGASEG